MPDLLTLAQQYAAAVERNDTAALKRLIDSYRRMYSRLAGQIEALAEQIGDGAMTTGQLARFSRFDTLMTQIERELSDYSIILNNELSASADDALTRALSDSRNLVNVAARESGIAAGFNSLPKDTVTQLLGFLQDGSPLMENINRWWAYHAQQIRDLFVEGVGLGWNPRKIAMMIRRNGFGMSLTDALRMTRTAQIYAYREATRANYVASDVVTGWQWMAHVSDPRTCMSCISKSGTIYPKTTPLNDHHNGRCTMLPVIAGRESISETDGPDWFNAQPEAEQRARMGPKFYEQYKAGRFRLQDMSREVDDDVYGPMWTTTPLKDLIGARA